MKITDYLLGYSPPIWATFVAGVLSIITISLSLFLIFEHLSSYKNPEEQKFLIGVVLMVPCYSVESETSSKPVCRPTSKLNQRSSNILFILFICNYSC
ncbi:protein LAZ1-like isoform X2 [Gossypium hirsutum]|uniref:Protein LAZ1-like isoform X2 n=1 Tax=Gossypium hirsutum TaxID=3635 RepID=A0A1U8PDC4_GOSHI|nr:protein LAZ1-like isoform X2 [Gossypium hirsutum]